MSLAVVIPWCNRPELGRTIRKNSELLAEHDAEIIIVNCGGSIEALKMLLTKEMTRMSNVISINTTNFNKAMAINVGVAETRQDTILTLDADIILSPAFLEGLAVIGQHSACLLRDVTESKSSNRYSDGLQDMEIEHTIAFRLGERVATIVTNRANARRGTRSGTGIAIMRKSVFELIDGLHSGLLGWGWEDVDLAIRAQFATGMPLAYVGSGLHLTHGNSVRNLRGLSQEESEAKNYLHCMSRYLVGDFHGTYAEDVKTTTVVQET